MLMSVENEPKVAKACLQVREVEEAELSQAVAAWGSPCTCRFRCHQIYRHLILSWKPSLGGQLVICRVCVGISQVACHA